jgi:hypothetical protein
MVHKDRTQFLLIILFFFGREVEPSPLLLRPFVGLLYQPWMIHDDDDDDDAVSGMNDKYT